MCIYTTVNAILTFTHKVNVHLERLQEVGCEACLGLGLTNRGGLELELALLGDKERFKYI